MTDSILIKALISLPLDIFKGLWQLWWIWLIVFIVWFLKEFGPVIAKRIKLDRKYAGIDSMKSDREKINELRHLKPAEFEDYIANLYYNLGYNTERVGQSYDGGIDVIAEKDGVKHYIQCKKFITRKVRVGAVRDFYGAMTGKLANGKGIFITTNVFTTEAERFAEDNLIELIDSFGLLRLIKSANMDQSTSSASLGNAQVLEQRIKCPACDGYLVKRSGKYGEFWGCSNYPKCRYIKH